MTTSQLHGQHGTHTHIERAQRLSLRRLARAAERGVTLVEVLIVVAIMALIAGGAGFLILPKWKQAQVKTATTTARNIRQVTISYMALQGGGDCPTVQTLIAAKELDSAGETEDPWGQPYEIDCSAGDDITVRSSGPDKKAGTDDDIVVGPIGGEG